MIAVQDVPLPAGVSLPGLCRALRDAGAVFAFLHGSRVEGRAEPASDRDVAAWFGREVPAWDVPLPAGCDLLVLDTAGLELAGRVAQRGVLLLDDDPPARVAWQADRCKRYLSEASRRAQLVDTVLRRDPVRLARLLQRLGEQLSVLRERAAEDRTRLRADEVLLSATKYRFVTAIEAMMDVAHHLLASELWGPADSSADALRLLGRHGILDDELAERTARAVGFRNVLVHGYAEVDDDRVAAQLAALGDLQRFVDQVADWAGRHG